MTIFEHYSKCDKREIFILVFLLCMICVKFGIENSILNMCSKKLGTVLLFILISVHLMGQTDKVYTIAGDILIGELKSLQQGVLLFDTDYADSKFQIDWDEVTGIEIGKDHLVYTDDGNRYRGSLIPLNGEGRLTRLITAEGELTMSLSKIVEIVSLEKQFWDRINIAIDAGLSVTKANNVRQRSIASDVSYRGNKWLVTALYSNIGTTQDNVDPISRGEGSFSLTRDVFGNAIAISGIEFLSSSEQQLDLRSTGRLGGGYYFIRNNRIYFFGGAGLAVTNEKYGGENPSRENNLEGVGHTEFHAYNMGDLSLSAKLMAYPSITQPGRWRVNSDIVFKYDLPLDFYIKLSFIHNFDSKPPEGVSTTDYSFQTSLGWEWN